MVGTRHLDDIGAIDLGMRAQGSKGVDFAPAFTTQAGDAFSAAELCRLAGASVTLLGLRGFGLLVSESLSLLDGLQESVVLGKGLFLFELGLGATRRASHNRGRRGLFLELNETTFTEGVAASSTCEGYTLEDDTHPNKPSIH